MVQAVPCPGRFQRIILFEQRRKKRVGVFKPADEEPFAENNPRGYVPHHRGAASSSSSSSSDASDGV